MPRASFLDVPQLHQPAKLQPCLILLRRVPRSPFAGETYNDSSANACRSLKFVIVLDTEREADIFGASFAVLTSSLTLVARLSVQRAFCGSFRIVGHGQCNNGGGWACCRAAFAALQWLPKQAQWRCCSALPSGPSAYTPIRLRVPPVPRAAALFMSR